MKRRRPVHEKQLWKSRQAIANKFLLNTALKFIMLESLTLHPQNLGWLRESLLIIQQRTSRKSRATLIPNSCIWTGQMAAIHRLARLNRLQLKTAILQGLLAGVRHPN